MCYNIKNNVTEVLGVQQFLQKQLHQNVEVMPYFGEIPLPFYLKNSYELSLAKILGIEFLLIRPLDKIHFATLQKHHSKLRALTGLQCVLYFKELSQYTYYKLIELGIPFIQEERQIYLPFLGVVLAPRALERKALEKRDKVSFMTQRFLLLAIYRHWNEITVTKAAEEMNISKMSISRCFDELEAIGVQCIQRNKRGRSFAWGKSWRSLWEVVRDSLQNPIAKQYNLEKRLGYTNLMLAGISALSEYSMLNDNAYVVYAVDKKMAAELFLEDKECVPDGEVPAEIITVMQYVIPFKDGKTIDPLSIILMLSKADREDPRVEMAVDEMIKENLWLKD